MSGDAAPPPERPAGALPSRNFRGRTLAPGGSGGAEYSAPMSSTPAGAVTWIDLVDPDQGTIEAAVGRTLHPRALDQLLAPHRHRDDPRPTLEGHGDYVFGVFLVPHLLDDSTVLYREVDMVAAQDLVLTVRKSADPHG